MKTYDIRDEDQRQALADEQLVHWLLYGGLHMTTDGAFQVTLLEPGDYRLELR